MRAYANPSPPLRALLGAAFSTAALSLGAMACSAPTQYSYDYSYGYRIGYSYSPYSYPGYSHSSYPLYGYPHHWHGDWDHGRWDRRWGARGSDHSGWHNGGRGQEVRGDHGGGRRFPNAGSIERGQQYLDVLRSHGIFRSQ
jgi:hypothetical protein